MEAARSYRFWRALALALLVHLAAYLPSLPNAFVFDDHTMVEGRPEVTGQAPIREVFLRPWFHENEAGAAVAYRPVARLSLGLDVRAFGLEPLPLRLGNLLWGALGAALLGLLIAEVEAPAVAADVIVVLFSAHPARSDVLLAIVGRAELLAFAAVAGALFLALRSSARTGPPRWGLALSSALVLSLGLLSKESAFAAPILLGATALLRTGDVRIRDRLSRLGPTAICWGLAVAGVFALRLATLGGFLTGPNARIAPIENKLASEATAGRVSGAVALVPLAAERLVWPRTLVADYGSNAIADAELEDPRRIAAGGAILLFVAGAALFLRTRAPVASLGLTWTLLSYLPFANIAYPTAVLFTERLLFLPAAGIALLAGDAVTRIPRTGRRSALLAVGLVVLAGASRIWSRIPDWRDDRTLFTATVRDAPGNGRAWMNLGVLSLARGDTSSAAAELTAGLRADPGLRPRIEGMRRHAAGLHRADLERAIDEALNAPGK
ncbi:MAG: hypothetical protein ACYDBY_09980 [Thermoanaerobaculia bacterium]